MKNFLKGFILGGFVLSSFCISSVCGGEGDHENNEDIAARPSRASENVQDRQRPVMFFSAERNDEGEEEDEILLLPQQTVGLQDFDPVLETPGPSAPSAPFYQVHPCVAVFFFTSGVVAFGATPIIAAAMICASICAPRLAVCMAGFFSNQGFAYCPANETEPLNNNISKSI